MLESALHKSTWFVTLTYAVEPEGRTLVPRDLQLFLKRLRKVVLPETFRFFAVGEYGELTGRPHYHLIIYGLDRSDLACTFVGRKKTGDGLIFKTWGLGLCDVQRAGKEAFQYVAGYVIKKLTKAGAEGLDGRHPEFTRMSRNPGIGGDAALSLIHI